MNGECSSCLGAGCMWHMYDYEICFGCFEVSFGSWILVLLLHLYSNSKRSWFSREIVHLALVVTWNPHRGSSSNHSRSSRTRFQDDPEMVDPWSTYVACRHHIWRQFPLDSTPSAVRADFRFQLPHEMSTIETRFQSSDATCTKKQEWSIIPLPQRKYREGITKAKTNLTWLSLVAHMLRLDSISDMCMFANDMITSSCSECSTAAWQSQCWVLMSWEINLRDMWSYCGHFQIHKHF